MAGGLEQRCKCFPCHPALQPSAPKNEVERIREKLNRIRKIPKKNQKAGRLEAGRLEGWRAGGLEGWKGLKAGGWEAGPGTLLESWKAGKLKGWKAAGLEGWRATRFVGCAASLVS